VVNNPVDSQLIGAVARADALSLISEAIAARSLAKTE